VTFLICTLVLRCTNPLPISFFEGSACVQQLREAGVNVLVFME
jgi:hypothetical protein